MGVLIGATDAVTGDYYSTWAKLRSPILGQGAAGGPSIYSAHNSEYAAGDGFMTSHGTLLRFDMRDSSGPVSGFWRPTFLFQESVLPVSGWYGQLFPAGPTITDEDIVELTGETVVASGTIGTFNINSDFFSPNPGQLLMTGSGFSPPYPVEQPIFSVGKLTAF
jgi:hypothetical protein